MIKKSKSQRKDFSFTKVEISFIKVDKKSKSYMIKILEILVVTFSFIKVDFSFIKVEQL